MFKGFQKPKRLVANTETLTDRYGQFTAQPFQRGFGTTIGNSLRRVLLSSIEGAAITAVKIEGVDHEFSPNSRTEASITHSDAGGLSTGSPRSRISCGCRRRVRCAR